MGAGGQDRGRRGPASPPAGDLSALADGERRHHRPGGGAASRTPSLVAKVQDAKVQVEGKDEVATAKVSVGGVAGRKLTLQWGLVDALQGNESQDEIVLHRYVFLLIVLFSIIVLVLSF